MSGGLLCGGGAAGWTCSGTFDPDRRILKRCKFNAATDQVQRTYWRMPTDLACQAERTLAAE
jgi:hypothetical protein